MSKSSDWVTRVNEYSIDSKGDQNTVTIELVESYFQRFCSDSARDASIEMTRFDPNVLGPFMEWICENTRVGTASTLQTYWDSFRQAYAAHMLARKEPAQIPYATKAAMDDARAFCIREYGLRTQPKAKDIARVEDIFELLKTLFLSPQVTFTHERHRVELMLIMNIAGATGNRPSAVLQLRYEDVDAAILQGSQGPRLSLKFSFKHTKKYKGQHKGTNQMEIFPRRNDPCLLLCPQIAFLALAFTDGVFANPSLRSPEVLFQLDIDPGRHSQPIRWEKNKAKQYIFRKSERKGTAYQVSSDRWSPQFLNSCLNKVGHISGMENPTGLYTIRRAAAESFESCEHISDEQINIILGHRNSVVRREHYLSKHITVDFTAAYRGLAPESAMIRNATSMRRNMDPRRPFELTEAQKQEVEEDPHLQTLRDILAQFRRQYREDKHNKTKFRMFQEAKKILRREKQRRMKKKLNTARASFDQEQPIIDIERQLRGEEPPKLISTEESYMLPERSKAVTALLPLDPDTDPRDEYSRRTEVINALCDLSTRQESRPHRLDSRMSKVADTQLPERKPNALPYTAKVSDPLLCINCLGDSDLPTHQRVKAWNTRRRLKRHLKSCLSDLVKQGVPFACPLSEVCKAKLQDFEHFLSHADTEHGTPTHVRKTFLDDIGL